MTQKTLFSLLAVLLLITTSSLACTNIIVTKGASGNNSNMIAYTCDGEFHPHLNITPAQDHQPGDSLTIYSYRGEVLGKIAQVAHTYRVLGYHNMNEFQVAMGETTFSGREELQDTKAFLHYWTLMKIALQRSKTAREAIQVMTDLVAEYGYSSTGESFSIADKNEAWLLEMIGMGPGRTGAVWVAVKIPDGYLCAHANRSRIGEFPLNDFENCIYSPNVISFATERGYYNDATDGPFRFNDVYDPATPASLRYCESRVWSIFRRAAPSQTFSPDYHRGVQGAERYPLFIKPDKKLLASDVMSLIRDHYEGTEFDQTQGIAAGPFGNPNRWRPLVWDYEGKEATWERCISTYNTGFSIVTQSRNHLPDEIGGLVWYGVDDSYFTCYAPVYVCADSVPSSYHIGNLTDFSMESVFWVFNLVSNYTNVKYCYMVKDVQKEQARVEERFFAKQDSVEQAALAIHKKDKQQAIELLSKYSFNQMEYVFKEWTDLSASLISKYNDGYIKNERGRPENAGYPKAWQDEVMKDGKGLFLPVWEKRVKTEEPKDY
ncbi:MAG: C69 family dipeptidase [Bacteroidales bacterium]|nr:C69 family dipeptidase [Bacteroidales bacterium]MCF8456075.1 C69 family dipeptidase [Bacteroidales bacterium]